MPYVNVPNDLSKIKTKMAFNLTKRQLVCFGSAGAVGIPAYLLTRGTLGNTGAMFLMMVFAFSLDSASPLETSSTSNRSFIVSCSSTPFLSVLPGCLSKAPEYPAAFPPDPAPQTGP